MMILSSTFANHHQNWLPTDFEDGLGRGRITRRAVNNVRALQDCSRLIAEHTKHGQGREALRVYKKMREEGMVASNYTFVVALKACSSLGDLEAGKEIHAHVMESKHRTDIMVANTLVSMYAKCGSIEEALLVFEGMAHRNVVSWNSIIKGCIHMEMGESALALYDSMQHEGFIPNGCTFVAVLQACSSLAAHEEAKTIHGESLKLRCLEQGRSIHAQVVATGFEKDAFVASTLIDMYAKCGSMIEAQRVYENMVHRNVVSWNTMILGYANAGMGELALELYERMRHEAIMPNSRTFVAVLKACGSLAAQEKNKAVDGEVLSCLKQGRALHAEVLKGGFEANIFVANTLVDMYVKCGSIVEAREVFKNIVQKNVVSWTAMILGYAQMDMGELALNLYARMRHEGYTPNDRTFIAALKACGSLVSQQGNTVDDEFQKIRWLEQGRSIHAEIAKRRLELNIFVANTLVDFYAKCGSMVEAQQVFEKMVQHNVVSWNTMIIGYAQMDMGDLALKLYARMQHEGFTPDNHTFVAALKACGGVVCQEGSKVVDGKLLKMRCLEQGRSIHAEVVRRGFESDIFIANALLDMYGKCGSIVEAWQVFEKMAHRDVVSWTAMIIAYAQMEKGKFALELYERMQQEGLTPNSRTFVAVLKACGSLVAVTKCQAVDRELPKMLCLNKVRTIHAEVVKTGLESDIFVANTLVDVYSKCGSIGDAHRAFEKIVHRDVISWNAMIIGYAQMEMGELALELYADMQQEGFTPDDRTFVAALKACGSLVARESKAADEYLKARCLAQGRSIHAEVVKCGFESDIFVANTLLDMYVKCGSMVDAHRLFEKMVHRDVVSWTTMIMGYAQMEMGGQALALYVSMQYEGLKPNCCTFIAVLKACSNVASLELGKEIHAQIHRAGLEEDMFVASCLVDMYGNCGSMADAQELFDSLRVRDSATWGALIAGYSGQGDSEHVLHLYDKMQLEGIEPVDITFISILTACSHSGLLDKGQQYFQAMCLEYGISPSAKHYMCMIDLLGRAGQLDEAVSMMKKMPFKPDKVTWMTISGACKKWNHQEIGRNAFECMVILDANCSAAYILMKNIYSFGNMTKVCAEIYEKVASIQDWNKLGCSRCTDNAGVVPSFLVDNKNHLQRGEIYEK